jgi:RNA polymerase sigma-70 factor (ECF subfamily)
MTRARAEYLSAPLVTVRLRQSASAGQVDEDLEREFEARVADCSTLAFRVAFSVLRQQQDAEDVAQEAFVRAHRSFRALRNRESFRAWLVRTTWRLALDHRRGEQRRSVRQHAHAMSAIPIPADTVAAAERAAALWEAIDALPEKLRITIVLSAIEGHEVAGVARLLGVPEGTVKSRLYHARQRLQERLRWHR